MVDLLDEWKKGSHIKSIDHNRSFYTRSINSLFKFRSFIFAIILYIMAVKQIETERILLIPYNKTLINKIQQEDYTIFDDMNLIPAKDWPDEDVLETLPRVLINLEKVSAPTGFESWMIIAKEKNEIIGDIGFKGLPDSEGRIDLGYGIVESARKKGYAREAASALIKWAFKDSKVLEITAKCDIKNTGSINLLTSINFERTNIEENMIGWSLVRN
ncbi:ribosomal-protein-alanine N-acetyltransferase [Chryseobacterium sp. H1D6B]|uniref:GNAT family N-acetyltransferase n=1 Tax=Chryseobacterium sp. H1D6B TaxID=2940588 RepID=UPI0017E1359F|nr:GNAT family N-acetyltransferase [Chryseobacterium sp. H1D6B]MDH6252406.1 ribosomal-protein-alanine N-acetyltransferase [Chryseobacterium sp. H1D6B]